MRKLENSELDRKSVEEYKKADKNPIIIVLDNVRSLNNIGSVFRSADAFLLEAIYLCGITAKPPHRDIYKTALGATDSVSWKYYEDTVQAINDLKASGFEIISIEQAESAVELQDFSVDVNKKYALIFGHEVRGVSQEVVSASDKCVEIPQYGTKHSFNISVSVGIVLWDFYRKMVFRK